MASRAENLTVFHGIYTAGVLSNIAERAKFDKGFRVLHRLLVPDNKHLGIERIHFGKCLRFAKQQGGIDTDRLRRLREPENYAVWKSVHNELLIPYFFAKVFKLNVKFVTNPNQRGLGDFQVIDREGMIVVEVKTPKGDDPDLQGPKGSVHAGLDEDLLRPAFLDGARQLKRGNKNLIVICTQLCAWIHDWSPFEKLFYGQEVITATLDPQVGRIVEPPRIKFVPDGELNKYPKKRFTRISAIASFRTDICCGSPFSEEAQQIQFTLLHNYHALRAISPNLFPDVEQFIPNREKGTIEHINEGKSAFLIEG
jgi:hypothetical protein